MNIYDVLTQAGVRCRRSQGNEIALCCPFCPSTRGEKDIEFCFHINASTGAGKCWHERCGVKGKKMLPKLLQALKVSDTELEKSDLPDAQQETVKLPSDFFQLSSVRSDLDAIALDYLVHKRGILKRQIQEYTIGVSYRGRYAYRIVFPVVVYHTLRGIVARDFTGNRQPKYLMNQGDKYLFGMDATKETLILAEGVFKALRINQTTDTTVRASALLGHDLTPKQLDQINHSGVKHIVIWPDPDKAGRKGAVTIGEKLQEEWKGTIEVVWPITRPADEMPLEELRHTYEHNRIEYDWRASQRLLPPP